MCGTAYPGRRWIVRFAVFVSLFLPALPISAQESLGGNVSTEATHFDSSGFQIDAFLAKPSGSGKHPAVLVIHDSQGLNEAIREIARQLAAEGYVALAPDFTSRLGGTRTPEQMAAAVSQLSPANSLQDSRSAFAFLQSDPGVDAQKISVVGFGWGGWRSFMLAASNPDVYRAVVYCATTPAENAASLHAPVLAHYAQFDFRTTGNALLTEKQMNAAGREFSYFVYPRSYRGFYFPGAQYDADAANQAWKRTIEFLK
jgi:carboxymethylenebutenolidase